MARSEAGFLEAGDHWFARTARGSRGWLALLDGRYDEAVRISLDLVADASAPGELYLRAVALMNAAQAKLLLGHISDAGLHLRASLQVLRRSPAKRITAEALRAAAAAAALSGEVERSGELFGAACATLEKGGFAASPIEERIESELIAPTRATHSEAFRRGYERGLSLTADEAIEVALIEQAPELPR